MIFEMAYLEEVATGNKLFMSIDDADDIAAAFNAGKTVILHIPEDVNNTGYGFNIHETYVQLIECVTVENGHAFGLCNNCFDTYSGDHEWPEKSTIQMKMSGIRELNGKLCLRVVEEQVY